MTDHATAIAERLHAAAERIAVDPVDVLGYDTPTVARSRSPRRWGGVAAAAAVLVVAAIWLPQDDDELGVAGAPDPAAVAAHVVSPPDWFGTPVGAEREGALRSGRWVSTAIGGLADPVVVSVFDGTYAPLDDAEAVTIDGAPLRAVRFEGWTALATEGTPTAMVIGSADERSLAAVLDDVEVVDPLGLRLRGDHDVLVPPTVLGADETPRRTLAAADGTVSINEVSDWREPLLYAASSAAELAAVDLGDRTGWAGRTTNAFVGPLRFLVWAPSPGTVFEITTTRTDVDLAELARATTALPFAEWDARYADPD